MGPVAWVPSAKQTAPAESFQLHGEGLLAGRPVVGVEQHQEQRCGVDCAVVAAVGNLPEVCEFAVTRLVDDASGLFAAGGVVAPALGGGEGAQCRGCRLGPVRQQEVGGEQ
jgi:hypothetical protein